MKVSLLKIARKKEVIKRVELREIAKMIRENSEKDKVFDLRLNYQFYKSQRLPDGQITLDDPTGSLNKKSNHHYRNYDYYRLAY